MPQPNPGQYQDCQNFSKNSTGSSSVSNSSSIPSPCPITRVDIISQISFKVHPAVQALSSLTMLSYPQLSNNRSEATKDDNGDTCIICCDNLVNTKLYPCQHSILCDSCCSRLQDNLCPICRIQITTVHRLDQSSPIPRTAPMQSTDEAIFQNRDRVSRVDEGNITCIICCDNEVDAKLQPCCHAIICLACIGRLQGRLCPVCRTGIKQVDRLDVPGSSHTLQEIQEVRNRENSFVRGKVLQILFVGAPNSGTKHVRESLLRLFGNAEDLSENFSDDSPFASNCSIRDTKVRLSVLEVPAANDEDPKHTLIDLRKMRPDEIVICIRKDVSRFEKDLNQWVSICSEVRDCLITFLLTGGSSIHGNIQGSDEDVHEVNALLQISSYLRNNLRCPSTVLSLVDGPRAVDMFTLGENLTRYAYRIRHGSRNRL